MFYILALGKYFQFFLHKYIQQLSIGIVCILSKFLFQLLIQEKAK